MEDTKKQLLESLQEAERRGLELRRDKDEISNLLEKVKQESQRCQTSLDSLNR